MLSLSCLVLARSWLILGRSWPFLGLSWLILGLSWLNLARGRVERGRGLVISDYLAGPKWDPKMFFFVLQGIILALLSSSIKNDFYGFTVPFLMSNVHAFLGVLAP